MQLNEPILSFLPRLYEAFPEAEWFLVGGAVRDALLGRSGRKDLDLVVRKISLEDLSNTLSTMGKVDFVGRGFGVLKFVPQGFEEENAVDIAWPRTERAGGSGGYRDFSVYADPELPIEQDLGRRDFTMNAVAWNLREGEYVDPYEGRKDIAARTIRAVGKPSERFAEDYSRMLRGLRFACQLGFSIEPATWEAIKALAPRINDDRGGERIVPFETVSRELAKAVAADPSKCVELYESSGLLFRVFPELEPLSACMQPKNYHSEGDVWTHTKMAMAALASPGFADLFPGERVSAETALAVLFHDVAKPITAEKREDGHITYYGHAERGAIIVKAAAQRLKLSSVPDMDIDPERLATLVKMHLFPNMLDVATVKKTTLVRHFLADRRTGRELLHLAYADAAATIHEDGKTDFAALRSAIAALAELEKALDAEKKKPGSVMKGEDVMDAVGIAPGPEVGRLLEAIREAQLRGDVASPDQAKALLKKLHEEK